MEYQIKFFILLVVYLKHAAATAGDKCFDADKINVATATKDACYFVLSGTGAQAKIIVSKVVEKGGVECGTTGNALATAITTDDKCCQMSSASTPPLKTETAFETAVTQNNPECKKLEDKVKKLIAEAQGGSDEGEAKCTKEDAGTDAAKTACYFRLNGNGKETKIKLIERMTPGITKACKTNTDLKDKKSTECCAATAAPPPLVNATTFTATAAPANSECKALEKAVAAAMAEKKDAKAPSTTSPKTNNGDTKGES